MIDELLFILALVAINGVLAGAELALVSLRGTRILELLESKGRAAAAIQTLRREPERFLATVQIGITIVGAAAGAFGGAGFAHYLVPLLEPLLGARAEPAALGIAVAFISYLSLVLGELVPKSLGLRYAERYALLVARPLLALSWLTRPVVWVLTKSSNLVLRLFGDETSFSESRLSPDELQRMVDEAGKTGAIHPHATDIASRALDFAGLTAGHVMVPRLNVVMLPLHGPPEVICEVLLRRGQTRMPVYENDPEQVIGFVTLRDLLRQMLRDGVIQLPDVVRPARVVAESTRAVELLDQMRHDGVQLAIVVDEQGSMTGIVTVEDLLEELVGEYASEHDDKGPAAIVIEADGAARVLGEVPLRDVNRRLGLSLPEGPEYSTLAGLCVTLAEGIPTAGERFTTADGVTLEVLDATARRVRRLRVRAPLASPSPGTETDS